MHHFTFGGITGMLLLYYYILFCVCKGSNKKKYNYKLKLTNISKYINNKMYNWFYQCIAVK